MSDDNKNVVLVMGPPNSGKTTSLRNLDVGSMAYINADNKEVPFRQKFLRNVPLKNAASLPGFIRAIEKEPSCKGGVLDTLTLAAELFERQCVFPKAGSKEGQTAWAEYGNYIKDVMHEIKTGTKDYVILAHEDKVFNEQAGAWNAKVPIKGAVGKRGVEADFSIILCSMQMPVSALEGYENSLLNITDRERKAGLKYVFVTYVTSKYAGSMMRAPMGMWEDNELYIDNDLQKVFTRVKQFYGTK
jgi:hypothetical protein